MKKQVNFIIIVIFSVFVIVFNIFCLFYESIFRNGIIIVNCITLSILIFFIVMNILSKKNQVDNTKLLNDRIENLTNTLNEYDLLTKDFIVLSDNIKNNLSQIFVTNITQTNFIDQEANLEQNKDFLTLLETRREKLAKIKDFYSSINLNTINGTFNSCNVVVDILHRIPYLIELLNNVIEKTEVAAFNLIDKFEIVHTENTKANKEAEDNLSRIKSGVSGVGFESIIENSKGAISEYEDLINDLLQLNVENGKKINKIGDWINQIMNMLASIESISEQNKIISINSSIEAARLGEKGKGFQVLALEIRKLNQKTSDFTREINKIVESFKDYTNTLTTDWQRETEIIVENIKTTSKNTENIISLLINSYEIISTSFFNLNDSTKKVDGSLNETLESLQFQDITRQQVENVIKFLKDIEEKIKLEENNFKLIGIDLYGDSKDLNQKIKDDLTKKTTVYDERVIINK
ncbi:MAG: hypothetical protein A2086_05900 [Spirochaetes bacterium GWD1_27_9]|nr:MAG: hypothetical protein A2Z98_17690 [Spirochaetes bacterium GWB1_27_13]OHD35533.1 MAG: hypothetical protein A2086_05900 [Spirochaetes bacterium GWD1_27_9]